MSLQLRLVTSREGLDGDPEVATIARHMSGAGIPTVVSAWSDATVDWSDAELTVIRSTWDYHTNREGFLRWADSVSRVTTLMNPAPLLHWNSEKTYLLDLAKKGLPIVPSVVLDDPTADRILVVLASRGWARGVLKPVIGLDGVGVTMVESSSTSPIVIPRTGERWLLQRFEDEVVRTGEYSLIYIGGALSRVVRKHNPTGDFRVQERFGGVVEPAASSPALRDLGERAVELVPEALYARVDMVLSSAGPILMELELIEPSFFASEGDGLLVDLENAVRALLNP